MDDPPTRSVREENSSPALRVRALELHGDRGTVYGPIDFTVQRGTLAVLHASQGQGRTSLLLTLGGRMVPDRASKELVVLGYRLLGRGRRRRRAKVQRCVALAGFEGIDELDESVTVRATLRERRGWLAPWYRPVRRITREAYEGLARPVFGDRTLPSLKTVVWELDDLDSLLLRIMLAMVQRPQVLLVDDVDQIRDEDRRELLWSRLAELAQAGTTIVTSTAALPRDQRALPVEVEEVAW